MKPRAGLGHEILLQITLATMIIFLTTGAFAPRSDAQAAGLRLPGPAYHHTTPTGEYALSKAAAADDELPLAPIKINAPRVPPIGFDSKRNVVDVLPQSVKILSVPVYMLDFGTAPTAAGMIAAYYDRNGYDQIYTGPTNGGVMPLDDSLWPSWSDGALSYPDNPLIASHNGADGRTSFGSIDDYWVQLGSDLPDPFTGNWTQHAWGSSIGDFMKSSQTAYNHHDGGTGFFTYGDSATKLTCHDMETANVGDGQKASELDGTYGRKLFYEARGYTVTDCFNQAPDSYGAGGFSFADFKAEIDAGRPVMLYFEVGTSFNITGLCVVGVGYDDESNTIYIHDPWKASELPITWGARYTDWDLRLLFVSIVNLAPPVPTPQAPTGTISDTTPTYTWTTVPGATQYRYQLLKDTTTLYTITVPSSDCNAATCSNTPTTALSSAAYQWNVQAFVSGDWRAYGDWLSFTIPAITVPNTVRPAGTVSDSTPTFTWSRVAGATQYQFSTYTGSALQYTKVVPAGACGSLADSCSNTPANILTLGAHTWKVRAFVGGAWKAFSPPRAFTITTLIPIPQTPTGTITDRTPTFTWTRIVGATKYQFVAYTGTTAIYTKTIAASACGVVPGKCSNTPANILSLGLHTWKVRAFVGGAWASYSVPRSFKVAL